MQARRHPDPRVLSPGSVADGGQVPTLDLVADVVSQVVDGRRLGVRAARSSIGRARAHDGLRACSESETAHVHEPGARSMSGRARPRTLMRRCPDDPLRMARPSEALPVVRVDQEPRRRSIVRRSDCKGGDSHPRPAAPGIAAATARPHSRAVTGVEESDRAVDRFDSARRTLLQHVAGRMCFQCHDGRCLQYEWAVAELSRHPVGRRLLVQLQLLDPVDDTIQEGRPR